MSEEKMIRKKRIRFQVNCDLEDFMNIQGAKKKTKDAYTTDDEKQAMNSFVDHLMESGFVTDVSAVIEEERERKYTAFERCNKMGAVSSWGWIKNERRD